MVALMKPIFHRNDKQILTCYFVFISSGILVFSKVYFLIFIAFTQLYHFHRSCHNQSSFIFVFAAEFFLSRVVKLSKCELSLLLVLNIPLTINYNVLNDLVLCLLLGSLTLSRTMLKTTW
jgi:hypothetical protein